MNEITENSMSTGVSEVTFVSSSVSVSVVFPRIKFPYPNFFIIVDFWKDFFVQFFRL